MNDGIAQNKFEDMIKGPYQPSNHLKKLLNFDFGDTANNFTCISAIKQDSGRSYAQVGDAVWVFINSAHNTIVSFFKFCDRDIDEYGNYYFAVKLEGDTEGDNLIIRDEEFTIWDNPINLDDLIIFQSSKKVDIDFVINQLQDVEF